MPENTDSLSADAAVQVALLVGLNGDGDLLPRAAPAAPQPLAPVST